MNWTLIGGDSADFHLIDTDLDETWFYIVSVEIFTESEFQHYKYVAWLVS